MGIKLSKLFYFLYEEIISVIMDIINRCKISPTQYFNRVKGKKKYITSQALKDIYIPIVDEPGCIDAAEVIKTHKLFDYKDGVKL